MATKAEIVSGLKQAKAELTQQLAGINAALTAFGVDGASAPTRKGVRKAGGKRKGGSNPQAAQDAIAVKRGTATPEQIERNNARLAAKAAKGGASAPVPEGASLAEAAAS